LTLATLVISKSHASPLERGSHSLLWVTSPLYERYQSVIKESLDRVVLEHESCILDIGTGGKAPTPSR